MAYYSDQVIVLNYHHIADEEYGIVITPERFYSHLDALQEHGFNVISMETFHRFMVHGGPVPDNAVVITFDDGFQSFYTHVYPEVKKRGLTATCFLVVKLIDEAAPPPRLPYDRYYHFPRLTWDQIREMKQNGMSFYSHTYDQHQRNANRGPYLTDRLFDERLQREETHGEYRQRIKGDLALAEKRLQEELGEQPKLLCLPYGSYNEVVLNVGSEIGIDLFFTIQRGRNERGNKLVYRHDMGMPFYTAAQFLNELRGGNA